VAEVRAMRQAAAAKKLVTQMGTQIHAGANYRRVVELIRGGAVGAVSEVQVYFAGRGRSFPAAPPAAPPKNLRYDLWLGPLPEVPYVKEQSHFDWRYWWAFGNGNLGDFGCHYGDLAFWALDLGSPTAVTATGAKGHAGVNDAAAEMRVDYEFPAAGKRGPVKLVWRHGGARPNEAKDFPYQTGVLFIGSEGMLAADYGSMVLKRRDGAPGKAAAPIPASIGHHREWLAAIRTGGPTTCNFDYSGNLAEAVLLGTAAFRAAPGRRLEWNAADLRIGDPAAQKLIAKQYRAGWTP
jgi:predicted dehydrogenase